MYVPWHVCMIMYVCVFVYLLVIVCTYVHVPHIYHIYVCFVTIFLCTNSFFFSEQGPAGAQPGCELLGRSRRAAMIHRYNVGKTIVPSPLPSIANSELIVINAD